MLSNLTNLSLLTLVSMMTLACGNPNSDRVIIIPDQVAVAPTTLTKTTDITWTLASTNARYTDTSEVRYEIILKPKFAADGTLESLTGSLSQVGIKDALITNMYLTQRSISASTSHIFFRDVRSENPLLQFNMQKETKACRFSWQNLVDTNDDQTKPIYDEVSFEGMCS